MNVFYENRRTGRQWPVGIPLWRAPDDQGPVEISQGSGLAPADIDARAHSLWRYAQAVRTPQRISLGEGWTPLVETRWQDHPVFFKCEHLMPSGSFKDRGIAVLVNELLHRGLTQVLEDSSGNAGASMATYCAAAGIECDIYAPAAAPEAKLQQIAAMGARLHRVPGTRQDTTDAALAAAETLFYASHCWQPFFVEGTKTVAFEIWEQMGFALPDHVVMPAGQGGNILGCAVGFAELIAAGQIERPPRLHIVQAQHCSPLVTLCNGTPAAPVEPTMADGIATPKPVRGKEIAEAVRWSGGRAVAVTEAAIAEALTALVSGGWYVEPTTAAAAAGMTRLMADGTIAPDESVVLVLTGHGLKAGQSIATALGR